MKVDWFEEITNRLRDYPEGDIWCSGYYILCKSKDVIDALTDMFECLYRIDGVEIVVITGYYDPIEDERNNEVDEFTGWWYLTLEY